MREPEKSIDIRGRSVLLDRFRQEVDSRKLAISFSEIHAIANHKSIRDREADIVGRNRDAAA